VQDATLRFSNYLFTPASVFPNGAVAKQQIAEVNLTHPPQLRLTSGEILFVPHAGKTALMNFVNQNEIEIRARTSVWSALLDPFLDTWEEQDVIDRQFAWLASLGLERDAVDRWRREVAVAMLAYNFGTLLWEWGALDLHDVLVAQQARLSRPAFKDFYRRAMQLTALDRVRPQRLHSSPAQAGSALHAVLTDWCPRDRRASAGDFTEHWDKVKQLQARLYAELQAAYCEPHRHYHTLRHIEYCLDQLEDYWAHAVHLNEVRWALLFHDAIYDTRRNDNEARSADWASSVMTELQRPAEEIARVRALILATAHSSTSQTPDEALLLDIDLAILGADAATFDDYDRAIRSEYEWVPEDAYRAARSKVLQGFLARERIFQTAAYRKSHEAQARQNLERALARLRTG
jgi:predicted metal-dependent HD superfamily phosphohydrolase